MAPITDGGFDARLLSVRYAAPDISLFEFGALTRTPLPAPEPGAHIDVRLGDGGMVRQYSLVTPLCGPSTYVVAVRRDAQGRGGSLRLHDECRVGQVFRLGSPRNHFTLNEHAARTVLLAGGIGITPVYSMFRRLRALGRDVELHYWCRTPEHAVFRDQLESLPEATLHYSREPQTASTLAQVLAGVNDDTDLYCCGPARMLDDFANLTAQRPAARNHVERFAAASPPDAQSANGGSFVVKLERAGCVVTVGDDESILHALLREGIDVSYSCEEGVCGACETRVFDGEPIHRDAVYTPDEHARRRTMMICCSRSRSARLVLDL